LRNLTSFILEKQKQNCEKIEVRKAFKFQLIIFVPREQEVDRKCVELKEY